MTDIVSPDVPAYLTYAIVLFFGTLVAYQVVNQRLADQPNRWAFAGAWLIWLAHAVLPVALFWFLDFTSALHDTSLFAALVVAFGCRQIFAGGVPGIRMPGQSSALWKPFEAWVSQEADRIATRNKLYADRFDDKVRSLIAGDPKHMAAFTTLALVKSTKRAELQADLAALTTTGDPEADARVKLDLMWRDFRRSEPDLYGWLLYKRGIVGGWRYWMWLDNGRSKITLWMVLGIVLIALSGTWLWFTNGPAGTTRIENATLQYHQWRFLKTNATERDRWRSRGYLVRQLRAFDAEAGTVLDARTDVGQVMKARADSARGLVGRLVSELGYPSIPIDHAAAILGLLVDTRSAALNVVYVPQLIDGWRAQTPTVRLETRKMLQALQKADYPTVPLPDDLAKWEPKKDETAADIDQRVRRAREWWALASAKASLNTGPKTTRR